MKRVMLNHPGKLVVIAAVTMKQKEDLATLTVVLGRDKMV